MKNNENILDWTLAEKLAGGNQELAHELFDMLKNTLVDHERNLSQAFKNSDWSSLQKEAHKLHGAACYTGTPRLKEAAKGLEITARNGESDEISQAFKMLVQEISLVRKAR